MTIIYFILVLTVTVMVHELGHFLLAKKNGVYVYEFSIGMGPKLISKKKGETEYSLRLFPIGGFVSMAGEDMESSDNVSTSASAVASLSAISELSILACASSILLIASAIG